MKGGIYAKTLAKFQVRGIFPIRDTSKKRFTQTFDLSLGLRNVLTEKAWENAVLGLGNEAGIKRGKRRKGNRKGRKRQKIEGKEEGKKRAHSPFLRHPFYGRLFRRLT